MKKLLFLATALLMCFASLSQDFTFRELTELRTTPYPGFEKRVAAKGYEQFNDENSSSCTLFRHGGNVISYCSDADDTAQREHHNVLKLETPDKSLYQSIRDDVADGLYKYGTKHRRTRHQQSAEYIYVNDTLSVHLYEIKYRNDSEPYYVVEVYSIYSGY